MKEELRLKKLGITRKKYDPDAQPWLMRLNGKGGRKYKGIREGGVSENTSFYVFTHGKDGAFEAFPVSEWYNFTPIIRYKTLDAEEAEERYANRGKILNKWAVMVNKKLKPGEEGGEEDPDEDGAKNKKGKKKESFKVSDMDDWETLKDSFFFPFLFLAPSSSGSSSPPPSPGLSFLLTITAHLLRILPLFAYLSSASPM